jgi:OFA family oxalate/formate antiporter-like MFS transporter
MTSERVFGLKPEAGRWGFVVLGLVINVCLGAVYAFSVFKKPLIAEWGITTTQSGFPFMVFLAMFAVAMAVGGPLITRWGPQKTSLLGGVLVGAGWILAGFSPNILVLTLSYGGIAGAGVGILYGCPIATASRWFPDRRGLAVGLTVLGFGVSALVTAPIITALIESAGVLRAFTWLGMAFLFLLIVLVLPIRFPVEGWRPAGWAPTAAQQARAAANLDRSQMIRRGSFYALWATFTIGSLAGLMAIGFSKDFGLDVAGLSGQAATLAVSFFAIFNGIGRPLFGWLNDRFSPRFAASLSFVLILAASALLLTWGQGNAAIYYLGFSILWLNLGGWIAIGPAATAVLFGAKYHARNYAVVFSGYGVGAILGTMLSGTIKDRTGSFLPVFTPVMVLAALGLVISAVALHPAKVEPGAVKRELT